jgi:pyridoxamine 5'-phosphate oxidase-like protein
MDAVPWGTFARSAPDLAHHVEERLAGICYLATVRADGWPRVHPVGVNFRADKIVVVMYPTSPKAHDVRANNRYAIHGTVEDSQGGKGEVLVTGVVVPAQPTPADIERGWIAFELLVGEVLATRYDPNERRPVSTRWKPS